MDLSKREQTEAKKLNVTDQYLIIQNRSFDFNSTIFMLDFVRLHLAMT